MRFKKEVGLIAISLVVATIAMLTITVSEKIEIESYELVPQGSDNTLALYRYYKNIERYPTDDYAVYVFDERDDEYLMELAKELTNNLSLDREIINSIAQYVQEEITYISEENEYPKFPIETIIDGGGDCEDKAILGASLLDLLGYNTSLIRLPGHMVIGVEIEGDYEFLEVSVKGWELGDVPDGYENATYHKIYNRPLVFHEWENVTLYTNIRNKYITGTIIISNLGRRYANLSLEINSLTTDLVLQKMEKVSIKFLVKVENKEDMKTKLYLNGKILEEKI